MKPEHHTTAALAAAVASEFNDELTLLLNQLSMLLQQVGRENPAAEGLLRAQHAALRCTVITGELLEYTRRSGNLPKPLPLKVPLAAS
jgi:signal transduction histidine kinase